MGQTRDELLQAAQAEIDRILDVHSELQADLDAVQERLNQLPSEPADTFSARAEPYDDEYDRIEAKMAEADDDYRRAFQAYVDLEAELDELDSDDGDSGEALSVHDAADIWISNGMDADYTFGYTEDELRRAAQE